MGIAAEVEVDFNVEVADHSDDPIEVATEPTTHFK